MGVSQPAALRGDPLISPLPSGPEFRRFVTAAPATSSESDLQRRLQQDSIQLAGKTVFLNPFLYWRRFDANTDRWLREPGQLPEEQIESNRSRFYPEVAWDLLSDEERTAKDGAVEMFLKSLELISTFNPDLTAGQLLEVERKMAVTKKRAFERWVSRSLKRREQEEAKARRRFDRERSLRAWQEWIALDMTRQALLPMAALMVLGVSAGWLWGSQQPCRDALSTNPAPLARVANP